MKVSAGSSSRRGRGRVRSGLVALALCSAGGVGAREPRVAIPPTTLDDALVRLAQQTGADVISTEPGLRGVQVPGVSGALSARDALERLLANSGYRAVAVDGRSFRIVRAPQRAAAVPPRPRRAPPPAAGAAGSEVVVTASKQRVPLLRYPGAVTIVGGARWPLSVPGADSADLARATPVLQLTDLGPGRNKLFVRGIADSSFNGSTQSTASIYLGDVQIGFSEQDPDLKLYDMQSVQVLEGPQGTLYGSGAIGGIVRLVPNPVELTRRSGSAAIGASMTRGGAPGFDASGAVNLPIVAGRLGVRAVAYRERAGGYIDDVARGLADINRTDTRGGRIAVRYAPGGGWRVEVTGAQQRTDSRDAQYADTAVGRLERRSAIAQPFDSEIGLASVTFGKNWRSGLQMLSVTGFATYHSSDQFDATPSLTAGSPVTAYGTRGSKLLLSHETRVSRSVANGNSWVVGVSVLRDRDGQSRSLGPVGAEADIIGVTNVTRSASAFAEATLAATPAFSLTGGGRVTIARTDGEPSFSLRRAYVQGRSTRRFDPTAAFSWMLAPRLAAYGRLQSGFRTGGLAVARGVGRVADYRADSIRVGEVGVRRLQPGELGVTFSAGLSFARWRDIQADLVNRRGLPYTVNLGDATITAVEGSADWTPIRGLHAGGSFLYTANRITGTLAMSSSPAHRRLPETPSLAVNLDASYRWSAGRAGTLSVGGSASRVGRSVLGTGDFLDISQGRYVVLGARAGWRRGRVEWSMTGENLGDTRANVFAMGNPFELAGRTLSTPLRPLTLRLGAAVAW